MSVILKSFGMSLVVNQNDVGVFTSHRHVKSPYALVKQVSKLLQLNISSLL